MSVSRQGRDADAVLAVVERGCPGVARGLIAPLLDFLCLSRTAFAGDIEKLLILMVITARTAEHPDFVALGSDALSADRTEPLPSLGTNIRSIAESLEIPRETVRRKVGELTDDGFIVRHNRTLRLATNALRRLEPLRRAIQTIAVRDYHLVQELIEAEAAAMS